jgi:hypothetical protein
MNLSTKDEINPASLSQEETRHRIWLSGGTIAACFVFIGLITTVSLFGSNIRLQTRVNGVAIPQNEAALKAQEAVLKAQNENDRETLRWLTTATFPMFSSWIGIVLAFYFASGATRATNESYQKLLEDANNKIVASGAQPDDKLKTLVLSSQAKGLTFYETDLRLSLAQIKKKIEDAKPRQRLLVLNKEDNTYHAIVTLSDISSYLVNPSLAGQGGDAGLISLEEYLSNRPKESEPLVAFSPQTESVYDARAKMLNQKANNLIVTESGESNSKVIAYLTSSDIEALSL